MVYCVKSIQIWSFSSSAFSRIRTEYGEIQTISPYSVQMRENTDQRISVFGHFLRSGCYHTWCKTSALASALNFCDASWQMSSMFLLSFNLQSKIMSSSFSLSYLFLCKSTYFERIRFLDYQYLAFKKFSPISSKAFVTYA